MEDVMANFNDSLVTKMEEESSSQSLEDSERTLNAL